MFINDLQFLGTTEDMLHREIHIYSYDDRFYAVYQDENLYVTSEKISNVKEKPDDYLFTPYIEFIDLV